MYWVQFKWSQIQWISVVIARSEAIQGVPGLDSGFAMTVRNDDATI
ncbi:MAG: hypothetical protein LBS88_06975 [Tannerellaceae bacterium]|nr:hypothetical protein [Tannerellaceae bacterium]